MQLIESFQVYGHPNIQSKHKTTLMFTKDHELTLSGDCIVGVSSQKSLNDFSEEFKNAARNEAAEIFLEMSVKNYKFSVKGYGHPKLTYSDNIDIVTRKSDYVCNRTLMINCDKAAHEIPDQMKKLLRRKNSSIKIIVKIDNNL